MSYTYFGNMSINDQYFSDLMPLLESIRQSDIDINITEDQTFTRTRRDVGLK